MTRLNSVLKLLKEKYPYLSNEYGVKKIGVFGSVAKELDNHSSDIDIVVVLANPLGLKFVEFVDYLEQLFNTKVDVLTEEGIKNLRSSEIAEKIKRSIIYV
jgi:hypothetical protein